MIRIVGDIALFKISMYLGFQQINLPYVQKIEKIHNLFQGVYMKLHVKIIVVWMSLIKIVFATHDTVLKDQPKMSSSKKLYENLRMQSPCGASDEEKSPEEAPFSLGDRTFSFGGSLTPNIPNSASHASLFADFADQFEPDSLHRTTPPDGISSPTVKKRTCAIIAYHNTTPPGNSSPKGSGKK